ncbi:hypothetical protein BMW23_0606 [Bodo saltans virus]|uniref:Uncharacterized protein n=1 Tax=Bodo saltans virus TaxID=2024608 RepID=A0A2H4UUQ8_9VIRU|nr:hypothetical protein QJ851_gp0589 [Bodo saltans virus]ATZ80652.1 hypothetical protein BMW23_0606 [Bodo saltans virus]
MPSASKKKQIAKMRGDGMFVQRDGKRSCVMGDELSCIIDKITIRLKENVASKLLSKEQCERDNLMLDYINQLENEHAKLIYETKHVVQMKKKFIEEVKYQKKTFLAILKDKFDVSEDVHKLMTTCIIPGTNYDVMHTVMSFLMNDNFARYQNLFECDMSDYESVKQQMYIATAPLQIQVSWTCQASPILFQYRTIRTLNKKSICDVIIDGEDACLLYDTYDVYRDTEKNFLSCKIREKNGTYTISETRQIENYFKRLFDCPDDREFGTVTVSIIDRKEHQISIDNMFYFPRTIDYFGNLSYANRRIEMMEDY